MSAHTPGPWTVEDRVERLLIFANGSPDFVAEIPAISPDDDVQLAYERGQSANARLIAAAPDLLEAAKEVLKCRGDGTFGRDGAQGYQLLLAAIVKAGGK
jgi:hypothetical protein